MPRGVYERKPKYQVLPDRLRELADEIESVLKEQQEIEEVRDQMHKMRAVLGLKEDVA